MHKGNFKILYRGSDFDDEFGVGNYFTTDSNFAKDYTSKGIIRKYEVDLGRVFNIVNPEHFKMLKDAVGEITDPYADENNYPELIDIQDPLVIANTGNTWEVTEQFLDTIPNLDLEGFDSAEIWEDGIVNYVVFNPKERVKLQENFGSIKKLLNHINEATLEQTLSNFNMDKFTEYYIKNIRKEYEGLPDQLLEYVLDMLETPEYTDDFQQEMGIPYDEFDANNDEQLNKLYDSKIFKDIIKGYLENALEHTLPTLKKYASQKQITIYRILKYHSTTQFFKKGMTVEPEEEYIDHLAKYGGRLGIYWTADREAIPVLADSITATQSTGGDFDEDFYLFEVNIDSRYVNWYDTLYQRTHVEYGDWQEWKSEQEIRLYKNTPIKLMSLGRYNPDSDEFEPIDISKIKGKTFYA